MIWKKRIASITASVVAFVLITLPYINSVVSAVSLEKTIENVCSTIPFSDEENENNQRNTTTISNDACEIDIQHTPSREVTFEELYHINQISNNNKKSSTTDDVDVSSYQFELLQDNVYLWEDDNYTIEWTGPGTPVYFESDNSSVTVDSEGNVLIVGVDSGYETAIIRVANDYCECYLQITVYAITTTVTTIPIPELYIEEPDASQLYVGNTFQIDYYLRYGDYITWSSSDESVAVVDSEGFVTITGVGTAEILADVRYGFVYSIYESFCIQTYVPAPEINMDLYEYSDLKPGDEIYAYYESVNAESVEWYSSDESVASVDQNGKITINGYGSVTISITAINMTGIAEDSRTIYVETPEPSIILDSPNEEFCYVGNTLKLFYEIENTDDINWSSSNDNVASVDSKGYITINGIGKVTIIAKATNIYGNESSDSITIYTYQAGTVLPDDSMQIIPSSVTMNVGDINELLVLNIPEGSSLKWTSDNTSVDIVSDGRVEAVSEGTATIYAIAGNILAQCKIIVTDNVDTEMLLGDANTDGKIAVADAVAVAAYVSNSEKNPISQRGLKNADVHMTGNNLNASDALMIQQYATGIIDSL